MVIFRVTIPTGFLLILGACDMGTTGTTSHLGNPLALPVSGASTLISNATYKARRQKVENFIMANHSQIMTDIKKGEGAQLAKGFDLARVPPQDRKLVTDQLSKDRALYRKNPAALIVAFMVYGG